MNKELEKILNQQKAANDLSFFIIDLLKKYNLTYAEIYNVLGLEIANLAKSQIKHEN